MRFTQKTNSQADGGQKCFFPAALKRITGCALVPFLSAEFAKNVLFPSESHLDDDSVTDEHCLQYRCSFLHSPSRRGHALRPSVPLVFLLVQKGRLRCRPRGAALLMHKLMSEKCLYERAQCLESYLKTQHKRSKFLPTQVLRGLQKPRINKQLLSESDVTS